MPAADSNLTLDAVEKATLRRWIEQGAESSRTGRSSRPPRRRSLTVATSGWARRRSIASCWRPRGEGLEPAPEASRETLAAAESPSI